MAIDYWMGMKIFLIFLLMDLQKQDIPITFAQTKKLFKIYCTIFIASLIK